MKSIIIGIHGLGNKPESQQYQRWWRSSLQEGLSLIGHPRRLLPFELCYWADILHRLPQALSISDPADERFLEEPYVPAQKLTPVKRSRLRYALLHLFNKQLSRLKLDSEGNILFKHISDLVIQRYFYDLNCYYSNGLSHAVADPQPVRDRIRGRLANLLAKHQDKEILLIAHSMGAIIAYDTLAHHAPNLRVHTLITIGAPLGVPVVVNKIKKEWGLAEGLPPAPDAIRHRWYNLADPKDKVAIDYTLADDYAPNIHQVVPMDSQVANDYMIRRRRNPHKDFGYLRTPELAQICFRFLSQGSSSARIRRLDWQYQVYEWAISLPKRLTQKMVKKV
jgi:hypothetical protein